MWQEEALKTHRRKGVPLKKSPDLLKALIVGGSPSDGEGAYYAIGHRLLKTSGGRRWLGTTLRGLSRRGGLLRASKSSRAESAHAERKASVSMRRRTDHSRSPSAACDASDGGPSAAAPPPLVASAAGSRTLTI